jgi:SAM-dependent methyltransferase
LPERLRLVLLSALMLFVELSLIRWSGSNLVYLSYFSNFVLLGSFLGIGIGFLRGTARVETFRFAPIALALFVAFVLVFPVEIDRSGDELIYFGALDATTGLPLWVTLPVVFLAVAGVMTMVAEGVARTFIKFEPLEAYRLDIGGSIFGIVGFSALSFTSAPPVAWGAVVAVLFVLLLDRQLRPLQLLAIAGLVILLGRESLVSQFSWSPYYKVSTVVVAGRPDVTPIRVNGIPHQTMTTIDVRRQAGGAVYFRPYERTRTSLESVLIVGAGSGTDVAIALEQGAAHVDAVEIDPRLQQIGAERHPERPYSDPRVEVFIDDGRAFLERTERAYDLILFALPDSLTLVSGQSSLRLESYLFTRQAIEEARDHLKPGGAFAMYNYYREDWLVDRLAGTLAGTFGNTPCVESVGSRGHLAVLIVGRDASPVECPTSWSGAGSPAAPTPATDDWPFLYLRDRTIPGFYLLTLGLILLVSLGLTNWAAGGLRPMRGYLDLFFMGVAFLLLETKSVVQFALLFGTTWFVNALVFAGILLSVLAAVEVARRVALPRPANLYVVLAASLFLAWLIPPDAMLQLDPAARFVAATLVSFAPIFVANLVFAQRFREAENSTVAFGANLLGAMVGGVLEYMALLTGYQALLLVVAGLYGAAFISGRAHLRLRSASPEPGAAEPAR